MSDSRPRRREASSAVAGRDGGRVDRQRRRAEHELRPGLCDEHEAYRGRRLEGDRRRGELASEPLHDQTEQYADPEDADDEGESQR